LPDGRKFGKIHQNRPKISYIAEKNLVAGKFRKMTKSERKEAGKYSCHNLLVKPYKY
jgi:hypothetical protein